GSRCRRVHRGLRVTARDPLVARVGCACNESRGRDHYTLYSDRGITTDPFQENTQMANLADVTDTNFQAEVIESDSPVLVDFWAPWCGPCRVIHPHLEELNEERDDLTVVSLNVDENQVTAQQYQVLSIPTMILFKNGQVAK